MLQHLATGLALQEPVGAGPERGIVRKDTALNAVMLIFAAVDEWLERGELAEGGALHVMSMLVALREYVEPLPSPPGAESLLREDLRETNRNMREAIAEIFGTN